MTTHPPDRGGVPTEASLPEADAFDAMPIEDRLRLMNREDAKVAAAVADALSSISAFVRATAERTAGGGRLIYIGAGTSGRLGVLDAAECPPTFMTAPHEVIGVIAGGDRALRASSEGLEDDPLGALEELGALGVGPADAVLGVSAGGTTPYVLGAIRAAGERGALTGLLTCGRLPADACADFAITVRTGPEVLTGSTRLKAGTATKMVLNMISTALMAERGKIHGNLMVDLRTSNEKLRDRGARVVSTLTGVGRERALVLLDAADGSVKVAVVMERCGRDRESAERALAAAGGQLRVAMRACS